MMMKIKRKKVKMKTKQTTYNPLSYAGNRETAGMG
jgi:hypothetical protein